MTGRRMVRWLRLLAVSAAVVWLGVWSGAGNILDSRAQESGYITSPRPMIRIRTTRMPGDCSTERAL